MNNWQDYLGPRPPTPVVATATQDSAAESELLDDIPAPDPRQYQPWIIQRGRTRPALLLDLRQFEPRGGLLMGCQVPYHHLAGIEYTGDTMVSLDFGVRHFIIQGVGLGELIRHLQQGTVLAIQEFSQQTWPQGAQGPMVTRIVKVDGRANAPA